MSSNTFIALMIALAALWVGGLAADRTLPPPDPTNTPRENAAGFGVNLALALCGLALLLALYFMVGE